MKKIKKILKYIIISFLFTAIIITTIKYLEKQNPENYEKHIKRVTQNTKVIDANTDHNQALDVAEYAKKQGIDIPSILINFDTHSDIFLNFPVLKLTQAGVENWINELIAKNPNLDEIYWVMPFEEANDGRMQTLFAEYKLQTVNFGAFYGNCFNDKLDYFTFVFMPLYIKPYKQTLLIEPNNGKMNEFIENNPANDIFFDKSKKYKRVKIITCTKNTLPDFKNKKVFLSIDADYTSNSGFDTAEDFKFNKKPKQIAETFYSIFNTLDKKNIRPEIISLSLSPQYLPKEHHKQVQQIFEHIIKTSGKKDPILKYKRKYDPEPIYTETKENIED